MADTNQTPSLNELIDFLNDQWERREPDPVEELAEDLGAFLQESGQLAKPLSYLLSERRSMPSLSIPN